MSDKEVQLFEADLLQSVRQMQEREFATATKVNVTEVSKARIDAGFSQEAFAKLMGVSVRTLQEWEQGRRAPSGAAQTLLKIAGRHPEALRELVEAM